MRHSQRSHHLHQLLRKGDGSHLPLLTQHSRLLQKLFIGILHLLLQGGNLLIKRFDIRQLRPKLIPQSDQIIHRRYPMFLL